MAIPGAGVVRNLKRVAWKDTLKLAVLRAVCAGLVWGLIAALIHPPDMSWYGYWALMTVGVPFTYFVFLPFGLACIALANAGVPFAGLGAIPLMVLAMPGDPLLKLLSTWRPELVPCDVGVFNLAGVMFVMKPTEGDQQLPVCLALLAAQGGNIQKLKQLNVPEEDWAALATLPLNAPRPVGSAVLYPGSPGEVDAMLFASKDPDFKSIADHVITLVFRKDGGGTWSVREKLEPSQELRA